jgi:hypothetical protein
MIVTIRTKEDIRDLAEMLEKRLSELTGTNKETWIVNIRAEQPQEAPEESD